MALAIVERVTLVLLRGEARVCFVRVCAHEDHYEDGPSVAVDWCLRRHTHAAAAAMNDEGSEATGCGVYFNAHRVELFENDTILVNAKQPLLTAGVFVTIAWERKGLRVEVNGSSLFVPHAEPVERHHFCMAFMDVHMCPRPCWAMW